MRIAVSPPAALPLGQLGVNSLWLLFARVSAQGLAVVLTALVARRLDAAGFGDYALIASVVFVANAFTTFGTDTLLIRELARTRRADHTLVPTTLWVQLGLSALCIAALVALRGISAPVTLYSLSLVPLAFYSVYSAVLRGLERMDLYLLLNLSAAGLQVIAAAWFYAAAGTLTQLVLALTGAQIASAAFAWLLCRAAAGPVRLTGRMPAAFGATLRAVLPFALLTMLALVYARLGIFWLGTAGSPEATGWFSAAARVVEAVKFAPQALLGALFPMLMRLPAGRGATAHDGRVTRWTLALCVASAAGITLLAGPLIALIFGGRYAPSVDAVRILAWTLVPYALTANLSLHMVTQGRERAVLAGTAGALGLAMLFFWLLVPRYGLAGACAAALASEIAQAALFLALARSQGQSVESPEYGTVT